jgi:hypothetical protein
MANDPVIDFAQDLFGSDDEPSGGGRAPVPAWVAGATAETVTVVSGEVTIRTEGDLPLTLDDAPPASTHPDDLAYYLPSHFYRDRWGIYVRAAGVWTLARHLSKRPTLDDLRFAYDALLLHERFHFFAEYAASRLEVVTAASRYREYFRVKHATLHEEATANAHAVSRLPHHGHAHRLASLQDWMLTQPDGYRQFRNALPPRYTTALRDAAAYMFRAPGRNKKVVIASVTNKLVHGSHPAEFLFTAINPRRSPTFVVLDASVPWLRVTKPFPKQFGLQVHVFPNDHKPPHIHIDCPPGNAFTRYLWPDLKPYPGDARLRKADEKGLQRYLVVHGNAIAKKVGTVPWQ